MSPERQDDQFGLLITETQENPNPRQNLKYAAYHIWSKGTDAFSTTLTIVQIYSMVT